MPGRIAAMFRRILLLLPPHRKFPPSPALSQQKSHDEQTVAELDRTLNRSDREVEWLRERMRVACLGRNPRNDLGGHTNGNSNMQ